MTNRETIEIKRARWALADALAWQEFRRVSPLCYEADCGRPSEVMDLCRIHARIHARMLGIPLIPLWIVT